jgi:hypothetical protein
MSNKSRYAVKRSLFRMPPGWKTYYQIGVAAQRRLPKHSTLDQVGRRFGLTRQNAYTASVVALGKFLYRLVHEIGEVPEL